MAIYISRKERIRRITILVLCAMISLSCVLFLVANIISIHKINYKRREILQKIHKEATSEEKFKKSYLKFCQPIGWFIKDKGLDSKSLKGFLNSWVKQLAERFDNKKYIPWGEKEGVKIHLVLKELFSELEKISLKKLERLYSILVEIEDLKKEMEDLKKEYAIRLSSQEERITKLTKEYKEKLSSLNHQRWEWARRKKEKLRILREKQKELLQEKAKADRLCTKLDELIEKLRKRLYWLQMQKREAELRREAVGKILRIDPKMQIAFIDLTFKDRLLRGTKFIVFSIEKGGVKIDRGEVTVVKVGKDFSIVSIDKVLEEQRTILEGDLLYSEFYSKERPRNIAFAGELSGRFGKAELIRLIKQRGDKYQEKVDDITNFLVVGAGYENDPNYINALSFRVRIIRERDLYEYLGIPE